MPALATLAATRLNAIEEAHRKRVVVSRERTGPVTLRQENRSFISFSCNNYLGLTHHPDVIGAARNALESFGTGAAASRLVTGGQILHENLENALADWKGFDAGLLFGSGYLANLGVIPSLVGPGDLILLDRLSHACLIDAARLSGAKFLRFRHNDMEDLKRLLMRHREKAGHCLIVTETVFSMDGDRAPFAEIAGLAQANDCAWMADDAHGLGETLEARPDVLTGTLSKALGSYGGYALAEASVIDYLRNAARTVIFSTALPPADVAAATSALALMRADPLREIPFRHAVRFTQALELPKAESQIVKLILGSEEATLGLAEALKEDGLLAAAIRPPSVPDGTSRLRFSFSAAHTDDDVDALIASVERHRPRFYANA